MSHEIVSAGPPGRPGSVAATYAKIGVKANVPSASASQPASGRVAAPVLGDPSAKNSGPSAGPPVAQPGHPHPAPGAHPGSQMGTQISGPTHLPPRHLSPLGLVIWVVGLLIELSAFSMALSNRLQADTALLALFIHIVACVITAFALYRMMPAVQRSVRWAGLAFLFALSFFVPLLGTVGLLLDVIVELYYPRQPEQKDPWITIPTPDLPHQPPSIGDRPEYGDGALSAMLRYCTSPERRLAAVQAARRLRDHNDVEVLRLALKDAVDDVRLLAYSILDRKQQAFSARLKSLLGQLQSVGPDSHQRARLHKRLAQTDFEMIQLGLAQGEVQRYLLAEARQHIDAALKDSGDDRESLFLLGSIALNQGELDVAEHAFLKAQVLGMALEKVLPYLAEVAFRQQRFSMVTHYLRAIDPIYFRTIPLLSGIAAHWLPEEQ